MKIFLAFLVALSACLQAEIGINLSIDYLYWKIEEDQLYPVITGGPAVDQIKAENQKFEYTSGFRAAVGYQSCYEQYDIEFAWTRIHPNTTSHFSSSQPKNIIIIPFLDQTNSDVSHAQSVVSRWHLKYDMLDLELGRKFLICEKFSLRPHIGVKGGWIDQRQKMDVEGIILGQPVPIEVVPGKVNRKNNFQGVGPSAGIDFRFGFPYQFGVFSTLNVAILYGKFDLETKTFLSDTIDNNGNSTGPKTIILNQPQHFLSPTVQLVLGGDWERCISRRFWIRLGVAYEVQYWWDQMRSNNSIVQLLAVNGPAGGDLMIHGLTVQASVKF